MSAFSEATSSIADFVRAIAWPGVGLFLAVRYREHIGRLIDRLRKGGPAEFDPVQPGQEKPANPLPAPSQDGVAAVEHLRTPAVRRWEAQVKAFPVLTAEPDAARRESILLTLTAKTALWAVYERVEGSVFASQIELLNYLNAKTSGESADRVKQLFYEPAALRFPEVYRPYSFDGYLGFLQGSQVITIVNLHITITDEGREYLLWRIEQKKMPRTYG